MADEATVQSILNKSRKDKFLLVLNIPDILKQQNNPDLFERASKYINLDAIQFSIYGSVVPNISVPDVDVPFQGQVPKVTSYSRPAWDPITVNFTIDNKFNNWWILWYWLNLINESEEGYYNANNLANPPSIISQRTTSYQTDLSIFGMDEYNKKSIRFDYKHAFITSLGAIDYNYRDGDEIETSFTFVFGQFKPVLL